MRTSIMDTMTITTTLTKALADQDQHKFKTSKFKRSIMVMKISKHNQHWREKGIKLRRINEDDQDLAAFYYQMKPS